MINTIEPDNILTRTINDNHLNVSFSENLSEKYLNNNFKTKTLSDNTLLNNPSFDFSSKEIIESIGFTYIIKEKFPSFHTDKFQKNSAFSNYWTLTQNHTKLINNFDNQTFSEKEFNQTGIFDKFYNIDSFQFIPFTKENRSSYPLLKNKNSSYNKIRTPEFYALENSLFNIFCEDNYHIIETLKSLDNSVIKETTNFDYTHNTPAIDIFTDLNQSLQEYSDDFEYIPINDFVNSEYSREEDISFKVDFLIENHLIFDEEYEPVSKNKLLSVLNYSELFCNLVGFAINVYFILNNNPIPKSWVIIIALAQFLSILFSFYYNKIQDS